MNIKARQGGFAPDVIVVVATVRALKMHGGVPESSLGDENVQAVIRRYGQSGKAYRNCSRFRGKAGRCIEPVHYRYRQQRFRL